MGCGNQAPKPMTAKPTPKKTVTSAYLAYDIKLLFPVLFLVGIGIVMVYSASSAIALKEYGTDYFFLKKQAVFSLIGILALMVCTHLPYQVLKTFAYPLLLLAVIFLAAIPLSNWGHTAGGARRWLTLGGLTFQPSEMARFALVVFLAYSLSKKGEKLKSFKVGLLPHLIVLFMLSLFIALQPDFGTIVIFSALTWIMMFVSGVRMLHLFAALLPLLPLGFYFMLQAQYRLKRLMTFWDPWKYSSNEGYQIVHSLMAFGTGGILGEGVGKGYQKLFYLPEPHTDFIFSVIGEELGLFGVLIIIGLYLLILWRGVLIARHSNDAFGALLAIGLTTAISLQVCVNMGVALGLLPTKGLTLPFLSYGGTSLVLSLMSMGVLMNISAQSSLQSVNNRRLPTGNRTSARKRSTQSARSKSKKPLQAKRGR
jgi:cell division protein FtsW